MIRQEKGQLCLSLAELQAFARVETGEEEAILAGFARVANELCEAFLGQALISRGFEQDLTLAERWTMLGLQPVRSITSVRLSTGQELTLGTDVRVDIDHDGRGFISSPESGLRCTVVGTAGMAAEANDIPEPIRHGMSRLAAHLFTNRDSPVGELPPAVTALWRPYRRAGLCR